jgi:hypothetical protein
MPPILAEIRRKELFSIIKQMAHCAGKVCGDAFWTFGPSQLSIKWAGMEHTIPAENTLTTTIQVSGEVMRGLARQRAGNTAVSVRVENNRLYLGTFSVACTPADPAPEPLLPAFAEPRHLLTAAAIHSKDELAQAGLSEEVEKLKDRLDASAERAAKHLVWLGIGPAQIKKWIWADSKQRSDAPA